MKISELVEALIPDHSAEDKEEMIRILTEMDEDDDIHVLAVDARNIIEHLLDTNGNKSDKENVSEESKDEDKGKSVKIKVTASTTSKEDNKSSSVKDTSHYKSVDGTTTVQDVINMFDLNWNRGNILKYVIRAGRKNPDKEVEDLLKAQEYLTYEINRIMSEKGK